MFKLFNNKGQAMVEMVLILPVLLLILLGIFDFGRILYSRVVLENSARSAARVGVISNSDYDINESILETTTNLDSSKLTILVSPTEGSRNPGESLTVSLNYDVDIFTPFMSVIIGNPVNVEADVTMRVE